MMTTVVVPYTHVLTTTPRIPDDTVDNFDAKKLVDAYSENNNMCGFFLNERYSIILITKEHCLYLTKN